MKKLIISQNRRFIIKLKSSTNTYEPDLYMIKKIVIKAKDTREILKRNYSNVNNTDSATRTMRSFSKKNKHKTKKYIFEIKLTDEPARSPDF